MYTYIQEIYKLRDTFLATGYLMLQHTQIRFFLNATEKQILEQIQHEDIDVISFIKATPALFQ